MGGETAVEALKVELVNINLMWLNSARKHVCGQGTRQGAMLIF